MKRLSTLCTALAAAFILCACGGTTAPSETTQEGDTITTDTIVYEHDYLVKVGDMAPDFSLPMTDGTTFTLSFPVFYDEEEEQ